MFTACLFQFTTCRLQVFPDSRIQSVKVTDWPVNFTGLSGTVTDRPAKVTDCTVTPPIQSAHTVWKSIFGTSQILVTDRPV